MKLTAASARCKALQRKYGHLEEFAALILAAGQESA